MLQVVVGFAELGNARRAAVQSAHLDLVAADGFNVKQGGVGQHVGQAARLPIPWQHACGYGVRGASMCAGCGCACPRGVHAHCGVHMPMGCTCLWGANAHGVS